MAIRPSDLERLQPNEIQELNMLTSTTVIRLKQFFEPMRKDQEIPLTFACRPSQAALDTFVEIFQHLGWHLHVTPSRQSLLVMIRPKLRGER